MDISEIDDTKPIHAYSVELRQRDVDQFDRLTLAALYGTLQDAAIEHSASKGLSGQDFMDMGYTWMLNRIHIKIDVYPKIADRITVRTWAFCLTGLYAIREFRVLDAAGRQLASATSRWIVIDINRKRPIRLPEMLAERYGVNPERSLEDDFPKFKIEHEPDHEVGFHVRWSDVDGNRHANSACYVDWCVESIPNEFLEVHEMKYLGLEYKRELMLGDELTSLSGTLAELEDTEGAYGHTITRNHDDILVAHARTHWTPVER